MCVVVSGSNTWRFSIFIPKFLNKKNFTRHACIAIIFITFIVLYFDYICVMKQLQIKKVSPSYSGLSMTSICRHAMNDFVSVDKIRISSSDRSGDHAL